MKIEGITEVITIHTDTNWGGHECVYQISWKLSKWDIKIHYNHKCQPHVGVEWKVRGLPKSDGLFIWEPWITVQIKMKMKDFIENNRYKCWCVWGYEIWLEVNYKFMQTCFFVLNLLLHSTNMLTVIFIQAFFASINQTSALLYDFRCLMNVPESFFSPDQLTKCDDVSGLCFPWSWQLITPKPY